MTNLNQPTRELTEYTTIRLTMVESPEGSPSKIRVRGEFARADQPTANGRVYPRGLWEREIKRMTQDLGGRKVFGELDHPADGRTLLSRVSHVLTDLRVEDNGTVVGEAEILDTSRGLDLKALLKGGCAVGVSSRGLGSTKTTKEGKEEVQEDYRLMTFDFVAEPAMQSAYPKTFYESKQDENGNPIEPTVVEAIEEALKKQENQLRTEFAAKLPALIEALKGRVREEVRAELLADPDIAGAKAALEQVKVLLRPFVMPADVEQVVSTLEADASKLKKTNSEQALRIRELEDDSVKLERLARIAGFKYFVERTLKDTEEAEDIRKSLGDLAGYATLEDLKGKLTELQASVTEKRDLRAAEDKARVEQEEAKLAAERTRTADIEAKLEAVREEARVALEAKDAELAVAKKAADAAAQAATSTLKAESTEKLDSLTARFERLQEALDKSLEANKLQTLQMYAERKISRHPRATEIRSALNESISEDWSHEDVDVLLEKFPATVAVNSDPEDIRSRVRRLTRGGTQPTPMDEEKKSTKGKDSLSEDTDFMGSGVDLASLRRLSGIGGN